MIREEGRRPTSTSAAPPRWAARCSSSAALVGYAVAHLVTATQPTVSGMLVLFLMAGLGLVGFVDDYIKVFKQRSLGLRSGAKMIGIIIVGVVFAAASLRFPNGYDVTPATAAPVLPARLRPLDRPVPVRDLGADHDRRRRPTAVNLTDGLDGLAAGAVGMVLGAYVLIGNWQLRNSCVRSRSTPNCYTVRDPLDLAVVAAAVLGALVGFLWWNAPPARIFMGDTGSLGPRRRDRRPGRDDAAPRCCSSSWAGCR